MASVLAGWAGPIESILMPVEHTCWVERFVLV
jgi:hypothetical protein